MEEANGADKVVIIDSGRIAAQGTPNELKNEYSGIYLKVYGIASEDAEKLSQKYPDGMKFERNCTVFRLKSTREAAGILSENKELISDFEVIKGDMDDVFLNVTGKVLEGSANG